MCRPTKTTFQAYIAWCLTIHSSRRRFAARLNSGVRPWFQVSSFHPATNRQFACSRQAYAVRHAPVRRAAHAAATATPAACPWYWQCVAHVAGGRSKLAPAIHATTHRSGSLGFRHLVQVHSQLHGLTIRPSRPCFTAANFSGMFVLDCRRAAGRLNSGVRWQL